MMKKISQFKFLLLAGLFLLISVTHTYAVPVAPAGSYTGGFFNNAEVILDQGIIGQIDVGDVFWGVLANQNIRNAGLDNTGQTGSDFWLNGGLLGPPTEITGYFLQEVKNVIPNGAPGGLTDLVQFGAAAVDPNGIFTAVELAAGAVLKFYESDTFNYDTTTQGSGLATATDGTPSWVLSATGGYLDSYVPVLIPTLGQPIGTQYGGLNFLTPDSANFDNIDDPNEILNNIPVDFFYNTELFRLSTNLGLTIGAADAFHFGSNDPWVVKANPIPEPGTFLLVGAGMLALSSIGRRRKNNNS